MKATFLQAPSGPGLSGDEKVPPFGSETCPSRTCFKTLEKESFKLVKIGALEGIGQMSMDIGFAFNADDGTAFRQAFSIPVHSTISETAQALRGIAGELEKFQP